MVFIVAEIGVNWDGDFQLMEKMIQSAKSAGCNAVNFKHIIYKMLKITLNGKDF